MKKKKKLSREDLLDIYFNNSLKFIGYRARSEKEITDHLKKKKIDETMIREIKQRLNEYKLIDDLSFAKQWSEQRIKYKHKSLRIIKLELMRKGIDKEKVDEALKKYSKSSDLESINLLINKKIKRINRLDRNNLLKLSRYLAGKGFDWDAIKEGISRINLKTKVDD